MSFFSAIFGKPAAAAAAPSQARAPPASAAGGAARATPTSTNARAIQDLRQTQEVMQKRQEKLEAEILELKTKAKAELDKGHKQKALTMFKHAKEKEDRLLKLVSSGLEKIHTVEAAIEEQVVIGEINRAVNVGTDALKRTAVDTDEVERTMEEFEEQVANIADVSAAISQPIGGAAAYDDDELMRELEGLGPAQAPAAAAVAAPAASSSSSSHVNLPSVPSNPIVVPPAAAAAAKQAMSEDDRLLAELQAQMS